MHLKNLTLQPQSVSSYITIANNSISNGLLVVFIVVLKATNTGQYDPSPIVISRINVVRINKYNVIIQFLWLPKKCFFKSLKSMSLTWKNEQIERFIVLGREVVRGQTGE